LLLFATVAVNCRVPPDVTDALEGETETLTGIALVASVQSKLVTRMPLASLDMTRK
jgi:hypothetical protein